MKGSGWIEFVLWLAYIVPGVIYSIWRRGGEPSICPTCKKETLKPYDAQEEAIEKKKEETVDCEWCAEPIQPKAKLCKHCKKEVTPTIVRSDLTLDEEQEAIIGGDVEKTPEKRKTSPLLLAIYYIGGSMFIFYQGEKAYETYFKSSATDVPQVSEGFICKSSMAKSFGYKPEEMRSLKVGKRYSITWTGDRISKTWGVSCWVQRNGRVMWQTDRANSEKGRVRNGEYDEKITYGFKGNELTIYEEYSDGSKSDETYKVPASEIVNN